MVTADAVARTHRYATPDAEGRLQPGRPDRRPDERGPLDARADLQARRGVRGVERPAGRPRPALSRVAGRAAWRSYVDRLTSRRTAGEPHHRHAKTRSVAGALRLLTAIHPPEATQANLPCLALPARAPPLRAARIDDASEVRQARDPPRPLKASTKWVRSTRVPAAWPAPAPECPARLRRTWSSGASGFRSRARSRRPAQQGRTHDPTRPP